MEELRPRPLRLRAPPGRPPPRRRRRPPGPAPAPRSRARTAWPLWVGVAALAVAVAAAAAAATAAETDAVGPAPEAIPQPLALSHNRLVEASGGGGGGGEGGAASDAGVLGDPQQLPPVTQGASNSVDAEEGGANGDEGGVGAFEPQDQAPAPPPPAPPDLAASPAPQDGPTLEPDGREEPEETAAPQPPSAAPDEGTEAGEGGDGGDGDGNGDGGGEGSPSAPPALPPSPPRVDESGWTAERSPPPPTQPLEWTPTAPSQPVPPRPPFTPEPPAPPPSPSPTPPPPPSPSPSPSPSPTPRFSPPPPPPPPSTRPPPPPPPPPSPSHPPPPPPPPSPTPTAPPVVSLYPSSQSVPPATPSEAPSTPAPTLPTTPSTLEEASCTFGASPRPSLCGWTAESNGSLRWAAGTGRGANWVGGPPRDVDSDSADGGYAFLETSLPATAAGAPAPVPAPLAPASAQLLSAQLAGTGSGGTCLVFWYAMDGLSPAELSVLLRRTERGGGARPAAAAPATATAGGGGPAGASSGGASAGATAPRSGGGGGGAGPPVPAGVRPGADLDALSRDTDAGDRVLWQAPFRSPHWQEARLLYTFHTHHTLILEGWPVDASDPARAYRGYIAVDSVRLRPGAQCRGHCTFAAGFCDWSNERGDDFDWALSRGSHNPVTGPSRDSSRDAAGSGGYAFVDSAFPRRPGDRARLASAAFPATEHDHPLCMRLWFHMFGPAVGSLRVLLRRFFHEGPGPATSTLWELSGNAGNAWFMGELTVSSLNDYQVLLEATVGNTGMSDIAVDDLSFTQGPCPAAPQVAAPDAGDCTFEIDECGWASSGNRQGVEWERAPTRSLDARFRRRPRPSPHAAAHRRDEYFLSLGRRPLQSAGSVTQFTSREFPGSQHPRCLTFWYLMREPFIDVAGPSLGVLRVLVQTAGDNARPLLAALWQLYNHQGSAWALARAPIAEQKPHRIIFEGIWGPNRASGTLAIDDIAFYEGNCTIQPAHATLRPEDCSFERGLCGWSNWTRTRAGERLVTWQRAFDSHRPAHLADKTFGTADGYIFFDIFATNQVVREVRLVAAPARPPPGAPRGPLLCFTFWFAAFGAGDSTHLSLLRYPTAGDLDDLTPHTLWRLSARGLDTTRPAWAAAQVTLDAREPGRLVLSGAASNGGFAVDDVRVLPGGCPVRPKEANPTTQ